MSAPISAEQRVTAMAKELRHDVAPNNLDSVLAFIQETLVERDRLIKSHIFEEITKAMAVECHDDEEAGMTEAEQRIDKLRKEICR